MSAAKARLMSQLDVAKVAPRLWIGAAPPQGELLGEMWDCLVLCADGYQPPAAQFPGVEVVHAPFRDAEDVTRSELKTALKASEWTANRLIGGKTVLVTCMAGRNRSGLVTALSLSMAAGLDPALCGEIVRKKRGTIALTNAAFVDALNRARSGSSCELCQNKKVTPRLYEDTLCWAALCKTCNVPMVVLRRHSTKPTKEEKAHMRTILTRVFGMLAPEHAMKLDEKRRSIPDHWHAHARPVGFGPWGKNL